MLTNYLKIALRSFLRNRSFAIINILGLSIGIAFSCMLFMYVKEELSVDRFHSKSDRIYRVLSIDKRVPDNPRTYGVSVPALGDAMVSEFPEVVDRVRLHRFVGQVVFEVEGTSFQERKWFTADDNFFDVFDYDFVSGDARSALDKPYSLVLTESAARRYFGHADPVGKVLEHTSFGPVTVTGVIKDHHDNSSLQFDFMFSEIRSDSAWQQYKSSWNDFEAYTYLVVNSPGDIDALRAKMPSFEQHRFAFAQGTIGIDFQSLGDIYLHSRGIEGGAHEQQGQEAYIYIFGSMGLLLLIIASINYINLATAKAMSRAREIGVRKTAGARKRQLAFQFLTESTLLAFIGMLVALAIMNVSAPYFNDVTGKSFDLSINNISSYLPLLTLITLLIGVLSGIYPSAYLAKLKPILSLKGTGSTSPQRRFGLREGLVVFQFALTLIMIVSTLVAGRQLNFVQDMDMGYNKEQLMVIDINSGQVRRRFETIKQEYAKIPGVSHVAVSSRVPGEWKNISEVFVRTPGSADSIRSYYMGFDEGMKDTYQFELRAGRYFDSNVQIDSTHVVINEMAAAAFGLEDPLGATLRLKSGGNLFEAQVIGVMQDFNFQSLHQRVAPIVMGTWNNPIQSIDYFTLKITGDLRRVVEAATKVHERFDEHTPIEYHFLDDQLNSYYQAESRAGKIFQMGALLSIAVACMGVLGLATYHIERRTKELGIRKILGASGLHLFALLSSSFVKQIGIAFILASPVAYLLMRNWLEAFAYHVPLSLSTFVVAGAFVLGIALLTTSYRAVQAVRANPVDALKDE